ncbi:response regulator [Sphingobium boeckii]|uniref:CheY-like chemotaxis protein n=1 Tax=Sphingobium boeckii TaxID=1082345 RepID=A0A7W9EFN6_9SPHN|nr:response regulator [Sphingobium boeckii]MBB5686210.1 CheY-like chemotaxis protein [Sphingobium boeckii]
MAFFQDETGFPPGYTILLVEDDPLVARVASDQLESIGCTVAHIAASAEAAIRWIDADGDVDMVFSDIVMPGMNGVALATYLAERRPEISVLLTTGYGSSLLQEQARQFQVIGKPWQSADVALAIGGMAGKPVMQQPVLRA